MLLRGLNIRLWIHLWKLLFLIIILFSIISCNELHEKAKPDEISLKLRINQLYTDLQNKDYDKVLDIWFKEEKLHK
jgi:hypothetical protein